MTKIEGTAWKADSLSRKPVSEAFEGIVKNAENANVILVTSGFGTGKTFFVSNWHQDLMERDLPVVLFDAWRNDYLESPLAGFVSTFRDCAISIEGEEKKERVLRFLKKFAVRASPLLLNGGMRVGTRLLTMGLLDGDTGAVKKILTEEGLSIAQGAAEEIPEAFQKSVSQKSFHEALFKDFESVVDAIRSQNDDFPLIVLVDELDRCRPEFAINLLEDIKHFMSVPGVCFFVFCDEEVLLSQAKTIFGDKQSGEKYISKFYDMRLRLPQPRDGQDVSVFFSHLDGEELENVSEYLAFLSLGHAASIRQMISTANFLQVLFSMQPKLRTAWPLVCYLVMLRDHSQEIYQQLRSGGFVAKNDLPWPARNESFDFQADTVGSFLSCNPEMTVHNFLNSDARFSGSIHAMLSDVGLMKYRYVREVRIKLIEKIEFAGRLT